MLSKIKCLNPVIIVNPNIKHLILTCGVYYIDNVVFTPSMGTLSEWRDFFPYSMFSPKKTGVTLESMDKYKIVDSATGEIYSMYYAVPCRKCVLCRDKSSRDWSVRCLCESQCSSEYPVFVTLTYNGRNLPKEGVIKKHVQDWLKRLRITLVRNGHSDSIRYFLCSEYGSKYGRPHYHAIIWRLPHEYENERLMFLIRDTWQKGIVQAKRLIPNPKDKAVFGAITYVAKYMRKDGRQPAEGQNPTFYLASRRGAIGSDYIHQIADFYRRNPDVQTLTLVDKFSGKSIEAGLPDYFKRKIFPSLSQLLDKETRDVYKDYINRIHFEKYYNEYCGCDWYTPDIDLAIMQKYSFLPQQHCSISNSDCDRLIANLDLGHVLDSYVFENRARINQCRRILLQSELDDCTIDYLMTVRAERQQFMQYYMSYSEPIDLDVICEKLLRDKRNKRERELF